MVMNKILCRSSASGTSCMLSDLPSAAAAAAATAAAAASTASSFTISSFSNTSTYPGIGLPV